MGGERKKGKGQSKVGRRGCEEEGKKGRTGVADPVYRSRRPVRCDKVASTRLNRMSASDFAQKKDRKEEGKTNRSLTRFSWNSDPFHHNGFFPTHPERERVRGEDCGGEGRGHTVVQMEEVVGLDEAVDRMRLGVGVGELSNDTCEGEERSARRSWPSSVVEELRGREQRKEKGEWIRRDEKNGRTYRRTRDRDDKAIRRARSCVGKAGGARISFATRRKKERERGRGNELLGGWGSREGRTMRETVRTPSRSSPCLHTCFCT
jgi:hypothetical protein